jgi:hypothetical protein
MMGFQRSIFALAALGSALMLGGVAVTRAHAQTQPQTQPQPQVQVHAATTPATGLLSPLAAHPADRLSATRERPLFSPSRRPPAPPPAPIRGPPPPAPPPAPPNVTLVGIVMDTEEARAIVQAGPQNEIRRVRIGDDVGGWKVTQIEGRKLVLSLDSRLATFTMFGGHGNPAPKVENKQLQPSSSPSSPGTPISLGRRRGHDD